MQLCAKLGSGAGDLSLVQLCLDDDNSRCLTLPESRKREIMANEEARRIGNHKVDGLGQLKAVIPASEYFRWHQQERGCWGDKQFNREFLRDNPQFKAEGNS